MREFPEPIYVEDALRGNGIQIEVPPGEILTVGPFEERYGDVFRIADVRSFADLGALGLVPDGLSEQEASAALMADDRDFRQRRDLGDRSLASCEDGRAADARAISRGRMQAHLTEALPSSFRGAAGVDDPGVIHVYHHLRRWLDKPARYLVGLVRAEGIVVHADGVLIMAPTVSVVDVSYIALGSNGRLRFQGSMVNVRCDTLTGPPEDTGGSGGSHGPSPGHTPPWPPVGTWPPLRSAEEIAEKYLPGYSRERRTMPASSE